MEPNNCLFSADGMLKTDLCHHGVKGQKWGVRRYQNPDGTLTPEGKKRYAQLRKGGKSTSESKSDMAKNVKAQYAPNSFFDRMEEINRRNATDGKSPETDKMMQDLMLDLFSLSVQGDKPSSKKESETVMSGQPSFSPKVKKLYSKAFNLLNGKDQKDIVDSLVKYEKIKTKLNETGRTKETDRMAKDFATDMFYRSLDNTPTEPIMAGSKISSGKKKSFKEKAKKTIKTFFSMPTNKNNYYNDLSNQLFQQQIHRQNNQNLVNQLNQQLVVDQINQITQQNVQNHLAMMNTIPAPPPPPMPMFF